MIELDDLAGEARRERDQADLLLKRSHEILQAASVQSESEETANPREPAENGPAENGPAENEPAENRPAEKRADEQPSEPSLPTDK
jgi:hypothetical protein